MSGAMGMAMARQYLNFSGNVWGGSGLVCGRLLCMHNPDVNPMGLII